MARKRKGPWQRKQDGCWYTTIGRTVHKLGAADDPWETIEQAYHEKHAKAEKPSALTVAYLADEFLEFVKQHRSESTYDWYSEYLASFIASIGPRLRVDSLAPAIVHRWINRSYGKRSPSTRHAAARTVVRVMNWALAERLIGRSPLVGFIKPAPSNRETAITPAQFTECQTRTTGPFRDALDFLWQTGCRPQELRVIEARWIEGRKIVLPAAMSKGKKRRRVIYLNKLSAEIVARLSAEHPTGAMFRNSKGCPWTKGALNCAFRRLRKKTKIVGLCAYALRHGFITEALKRGVDTTTVGVLAGHANPQMVARVYQHLSQDDDYLLSIVTRLNGESAAVFGIPQAAAG